jgi:NAD(P)-dependent dehydrogenase (short-subunit alcohol dehydrogenase family)
LNKKVAFVTGANQGLGLSLVRGLLNQMGDSVEIYLTARNKDRGEEAVELLRSEGLNPKYHQLDINDMNSINAFREHLEKIHGGIDIVLHNAAARITKEQPQADQVRNFVTTNNFGTTRMIENFLPLLNPKGSFIIVASSYGQLKYLNSELHDRLDTDKVSLAEVNHTLQEYIVLTEKGEETEHGWPDWINIPSKIGQVVSMRVAARESKESRVADELFIAAVCPGLLNTEASRPWFDDMSHALSTDEGAVDILWLLTPEANREKYYGELVQFRKIVPWKES